MSEAAPTTLKGYIPTLDGWREMAILGVMDSIIRGVVATLALSRPEVRAFIERYLSTIVMTAVVALSAAIVYRDGRRPSFREAMIVPVIIVPRSSVHRASWAAYSRIP